MSASRRVSCLPVGSVAAVQMMAAATGSPGQQEAAQVAKPPVKVPASRCVSSVAYAKRYDDKVLK